MIVEGNPLDIYEVQPTLDGRAILGRLHDHLSSLSPTSNLKGKMKTQK
mgnify:CR=1 FL=1